MIVGVDEGGRDSIVGSIVFAAVVIKDVAELRKVGGLKSSRMSRAELKDIVTTVSESDSFAAFVVKESAREISLKLSKGERMEDLKAEMVARLLDGAVKIASSPDKVIINNFVSSDESLLSKIVRYEPSLKDINYVIENGADRYGEVALARAVAEYFHAEELSSLGAGSGKAHDKETLKFIYEHHEHYNIVNCDGCKCIRTWTPEWERLGNMFNRESLRKKIYG